jgi:hypothetical protein
MIQPKLIIAYEKDLLSILPSNATPIRMQVMTTKTSLCF